MAVTIKLPLLTAVLTSANAFALVGGRASHAPALQFVGQLVQHTQDADLIRDIVAALLPADYSGNTLEEVPGMVADAVKKGFDKPERSGAKQQKSAVALGLLDKIELFRTPVGDPFASIRLPGGGSLCHRVASQAFSQFVGLAYYQATNKNLGNVATREVTDLLEAKARFESPVEEVHVRLAGNDGRLFIDLGRKDGLVVEVGSNTWSTTYECTDRFWRPPGLSELPIPQRGGRLDALRDILGLDETSYILFLAFLISALNPKGPYFLLLVQGEQGSGKSLLCAFAKTIIDPSSVEKLRLPKNEHDLMIQANENWLLVYDNASSVRWDMSDALCALATGSGFLTRKFFTDNESRIFKSSRPVVINGIGDFADRPDLLERAIQLQLKSISDRRRTERQMRRDLEQALPGILGALFEVVGTALANLARTDAPINLRMADAAQWLAAAEPAIDVAPGTLLRTLEGVQAEMMADRAVTNPVVVALIKIASGSPGRRFDGTVGELHEKMIDGSKDFGRRLPGNASHLSNAIKRFKPMMAKIGLRVEFGERTRTGRPISVWLEPDAEAATSGDSKINF